MLPHFNSRPYGSSSSNNNIQSGANASAPQQVMGNQGNFCPYPAQIRAQFPMGMLSNPLLPMMNPNPNFALGQFFPFPQGSFLNLNTNLAHILARTSLNQPQFLPNGMLNLAQTINQLLQMQIPNGGPNNSGPFMNAQLGVNNVNGPLQSSDNKGDFVSPQVQQNHNLNSPIAPKSQPQFLPNGMPNLAQNINQLLQMHIPNSGPNNSGPFLNAQFGVNNVNRPLPSVDNKGDFVSPQAQQNHNLSSPGAPISQPQFLPNGMPNLAQNINQLLQMQIPSNGPNNSGPFMNAQVGVNDVNGPLQSVDNKGDFVSPQAQQNHNLNSPGAPKSQGNSGKFNGVNDRNNNRRKSLNSNFMNQKHDASQRGSGKQFHHQQNAHGNNNSNNEFQGKGDENNEPKNNFSNSSENTQVGKKRSLVLNYTEQEIRQWCEHRKKNYPSKANAEKKSQEKSAQTDEAMKMRRQQLKEILAKQAELGCEVAEIPSSYLSYSEQQPHGRQQNNKVFGQRGRFQNKFNRNGKFQQNDRFSKRQRVNNNHPQNLQNQNNRFTNKQRSTNGGMRNPHGFNKSKPSLLKKLLSSEIKRDKKHLLQVFRFVVMNSFFQNTPEKALKFPPVIVKELDEESNPTEEEARLVAKGDSSDPFASACVDNRMLCAGNLDGSSGEEHGDTYGEKACAVTEEGEIPLQVAHKAIL